MSHNGDHSAADTDDGAASLFRICSNPNRSTSHRVDAADGLSDDDAHEAYKDVPLVPLDDEARSWERGQSPRSDASEHRPQREEIDGGEASDADDSDAGRAEPIVQDCAAVTAQRRAPSAETSRRFARILEDTEARSSGRTDVRHDELGEMDPEDVYAKQSLLRDIERLKRQPGAHSTKEWTMRDNVDDMEFELKRMTLHMDESNNVDMMRNALQLAVTGIEMVSKRYNILDLEGWSTEAVRTMSKHDRSLARLYRKYWRRGFSASPESDIALSLVASMGMYHAKRKVSGHMFHRGGGGGGGGTSSAARSGAPPREWGRSAAHPYESSDDDNEQAPPTP